MSDWAPDVERLAAFDDEEWARVERAYAGRLAAYVARRVADPEARDDVVQEVFLGAVRGIRGFDSRYTFEQYLFGICRNRTIDHLRRRAVQGAATGEAGDVDGEAGPALDELVVDDATPSRIVREDDLVEAGRAILVDVLRDWVQETWAAGEFKRLMVVEALFRGGWRNRDTWERFELRDETAVAGIKFRALKRMRALAESRDSGGVVVASLAEQAGETRSPLDVAEVWRDARVSCPARHWLARHLAGTLATEPGRRACGVRRVPPRRDPVRGVSRESRRPGPGGRGGAGAAAVGGAGFESGLSAVQDGVATRQTVAAATRSRNDSSPPGGGARFACDGRREAAASASGRRTVVSRPCRGGDSLGYIGAVSRVTRVFLLVALAAVAAVGFHAYRTEGVSPWDALRANGVLFGRVELDDDVRALLARADAPRLQVRTVLPWGVIASRVDERGRFHLRGLSEEPVDLEVRLGGEVLATIDGVAPLLEGDGASMRTPDPRLTGIELDGPVFALEFWVEGLDGRPAPAGWLAWRPAGMGDFESVVPVRDGHAMVPSLSNVVDVRPLVPGYLGEARHGVFGDEVIVLPPGAAVEAEIAVAATDWRVDYGAEGSAPGDALERFLPEDVSLRLDLVKATSNEGELVGEALVRSLDARGGWLEDGVARLELPGPGRQDVAWFAFLKVGERSTRIRGFPATPFAVEAPRTGTVRCAVPLDFDALEAAAAAERAREGLRAPRASRVIGGRGR